jgi:hypothetical protein
MEKFLFLFLLISGIVSFLGAWQQWDWFMNNHKAKFISMFLGKTGARIFYILIGIVLAVGGTLGLLGIIQYDK